MIEQLRGEYPVRQLCEVLGCAPSSFYYHSTREASETEVLAAMEQVLMRYPYYGYRRMQAELQRRGYPIGEHVTRRLLKHLGGSRQVGRVRLTTTDSRHPFQRFPNRIRGVQATYPNQVWVADLTYIRLGMRFIYLAVILDAYTRGIRGWQLGRSMDQHLTLTALQKALVHYPPPLVHHSDQGSQYAAGDYLACLEDACIVISMSEAGQPTQNGLVERFIRTLKEEHVAYAEYHDFDDAWTQIAHWLEVEYMTERIHSALDYVTPVEFEVNALADGPKPLLH